MDALPTRTRSIELRPGLVFRVWEVLAQPRPNHWARVWPASVAMSRWLIDQPSQSLPAAAMELGCGMGLVSLTAAHLGLLIEGTDRQEIAVDFAARNATRNELTGFRSSQLEWSARGPEHLASQLLLASDVLYAPEAAEPLFELIQTGGLLSPDGTLVLAVPRDRRELVERFVERLMALGYTHRVDPREVEWDGETRLIDVHVLTRPH